jgi:hypothetical protein
MSKASIKAVDAYCDLLNWENSIPNCFPEERERWTQKRDRALAQFRAAMAKITQEEFLRGRWGSASMERRLAQWDDMVARAAGTRGGPTELAERLRPKPWSS